MDFKNLKQLFDTFKVMAKAGKKKTAPKKRAEQYQPKAKTDYVLVN